MGTATLVAVRWLGTCEMLECLNLEVETLIYNAEHIGVSDVRHRKDGGGT